MNKSLVRFLTGEKLQRRKEAVEETRKKVRDIRLSTSTRSIDETIGYLIKNGIHINYKGIREKTDSCIQDKYDKIILSRRYGNGFDCNNCGRSWIACKDDILEGYELDVKLRCPYCHNMINIPRNYNWY